MPTNSDYPYLIIEPSPWGATMWSLWGDYAKRCCEWRDAKLPVVLSMERRD